MQAYVLKYVGKETVTKKLNWKIISKQFNDKVWNQRSFLEAIRCLSCAIYHNLNLLLKNKVAC